MRRYPLVDAMQTFGADPLIEVRSSVPGWIHLRIKPAPELREKLRAFIRLELSDLPTKICEEMTLAVDELLSNSLEHGCRQNAGCPVDLKYIRTPRMLMFQIKDPGQGFSIDDVSHSAVNNPPDDPLRHNELRNQMGLRPGGFGIMLVKKVADELVYNEQGNEVVLVKYLDGV